MYFSGICMKQEQKRKYVVQKKEMESKEMKQPLGLGVCSCGPIREVLPARGVVQMCYARNLRKNAVVGDRHNIPNPFLDLGVWYKTLMAGRIADLYRSQPGFLGHAQQINQELARLIEVLPAMEGEEDTMKAVRTFVYSIKSFIVKGARKADFNFNFTFVFPYESRLTIKKENGVLYVNGKKK